MQRSLGLFTLSAVLGFSGSANALDNSGFTLETGSPDALCPALATAREVVARRLGSLLVDGHWRARYTIAHAPSGHPRDFVRLELFNPEGGLELVRDLPMEGESCRTMAEVIALVLDRHFRGLAAGEGQAPAVETALAKPEPPATAPAPSTTKPARSVAAVRPRSPLRLALTLNDSLPEARPSAGVRGLFAVHERIVAGAELAFDLTQSEEPLAHGGGVKSWQMSGRAFLAWTFDLGPWGAYVGPAFATALEQGTTFALPENHSRFRVVNSLGLDAGFVVALTARWFFTSSVRLDWRIPGASGQFVVDDQVVLAPSPLGFGAGLGFGYAFPTAGEGP